MSSTEAIKVVIRFRPVNKRERKEKTHLKCDLNISEDKKTISLKTSDGFNKKFNFDRCFWYDAHQRDAYEFCCRGIVDDVMKGYTGTIFAYGQTGSGKTYTILGSENDADLKNDNLMGFIPRVADDVFGTISDSKDVKLKVSVQYCEIYLDKIFDLFCKKRKALRIRQSPTATYVEGLSSRGVTSVLQVIEYLKFGSEHRFMRATSMNARSSRSHSLFTICVERFDKFAGKTTKGKFNLVDLAGSEKVQKTGAAGDMLEEAKKINQSLSALGNVINALVEHKKHIPYRDSPLTRILKDALGGNSKTTIVCTASPHPFNIMESISTMRFGERAKKIKCRVKANVQLSRAQLVRQCSQLKKMLSSEQKKNKIFLNELKTLKGEEFSNEYLSKLLQTKIAKKMKKMSSLTTTTTTTESESELEQEVPETPTSSGGPKSLNEFQLQDEVNNWKLRYEDKVGEIESLKEDFRTKSKNLVVKNSKFKEVLVQITRKMKKIETENYKMNEKMIFMTEENEKIKDGEEGVLLEWKEKLKFSEEDVTSLTKENDALKIERDELRGRISIFEEMGGGGGGADGKGGGGGTFKNVILKKNEKIKSMEKNLVSRAERYNEEKVKFEAEIKDLKETKEKRNEQCFSLMKKTEEMMKENKKLKQFCQRGNSEKTMLLKMFVKEKQKIRSESLKEHQESLKQIKEMYDSETENLRKEIEDLKQQQEEQQQQEQGEEEQQVIISGGGGGSSKGGSVVLSEEESVKKLKELQSKKTKHFLDQYKKIKKVNEDRENKNKEQIGMLMKMIQKKDEKITALNSLKDKHFEETKSMKDKLSSSNKDWKDKLNMLFKKLTQMKSQYAIYKKKFDPTQIDKNNKMLVRLKKSKFIHKVKLSSMYNKVNMRNKEIEKLQFDLIEAEKKASTGHSGSMLNLEKKFGNKLDILNELRGMRIQHARVFDDNVKNKQEIKTQREQLRNNRIKVKKVMFEKTQSEKRLEELQNKIKNLMSRNQQKLDDKERKITKLEMDKDRMEIQIAELEKLDEINQMFEYSGGSGGGGMGGDDDEHENDDDDDGYFVPSASAGKRREIVSKIVKNPNFDDMSDEEEEDEGEDNKIPFPKLKKDEEDVGITIAIPKGRGPPRRPAMGRPSLQARAPTNMSDIQKYIQSGRGGQARAKKGKGGRPGGGGLLGGNIAARKRGMRKRSKSFSVQRTRGTPIMRVNTKKFANLASMKGVDDSPYGEVLLRKTSHGLW